MSERIRGSEVLIRFSIDNELQSGSWLKIPDFTLTPRGELVEADYIGEDESDIDYRHDGFDFGGTLHELDSAARLFLAKCVGNHESHVAPPDVTLQVQWGYRGVGASTIIETFRKCRFKIDESSISRKEYVATKISGKCRKYSAKVA